MSEPRDLGVKLDPGLGLLLGNSELNLLVVSDVGDLDPSAEVDKNLVLGSVDLLGERGDLGFDGGKRGLFL